MRHGNMERHMSTTAMHSCITDLQSTVSTIVHHRSHRSSFIQAVSAAQALVPVNSQFPSASRPRPKPTRCHSDSWRGVTSFISSYSAEKRQPLGILSPDTLCRAQFDCECLYMASHGLRCTVKRHLGSAAPVGDVKAEKPQRPAGRCSRSADSRLTTCNLHLAHPLYARIEAIMF
jgi:hypothetical protein